MVEEWRKIEGFPDYMVSNQGRVCSVRRGHSTILKAVKDNYGYLHVGLYNENKTNYLAKIHRLVASAFISNPENKPQVNHIDGCKTDNNVNNLEWSTGSENMKHAFSTRLCNRIGINNTQTHLTEAQVIEIYKLAHTGKLTQKEIGELFGIKQHTVSSIKLGKNWKELTANIVLQTEKQGQTSMFGDDDKDSDEMITDYQIQQF